MSTVTSPAPASAAGTGASVDRVEGSRGRRRAVAAVAAALLAGSAGSLLLLGGSDDAVVPTSPEDPTTVYTESFEGAASRLSLFPRDSTGDVRDGSFVLSGSPPDVDALDLSDGRGGRQYSATAEVAATQGVDVTATLQLLGGSSDLDAAGVLATRVRPPVMLPPGTRFGLSYEELNPLDAVVLEVARSGRVSLSYNRNPPVIYSGGPPSGPGITLATVEQPPAGWPVVVRLSISSPTAAGPIWGGVAPAQEVVGYVDGDVVIRYLLRSDQVDWTPTDEALGFDAAGVYLYAAGSEGEAALRADDLQIRATP
jgi:hypothetical protein